VADPKLLKLPLMVAEVESLLVAALVLTVGFSVTIDTGDAGNVSAEV